MIDFLRRHFEAWIISTKFEGFVNFFLLLLIVEDFTVYFDPTTNTRTSLLFIGIVLIVLFFLHIVRMIFRKA